MRKPSLNIENMLRLAFPDAGSRYFPVRPLIYIISPASFTRTPGGENCCNKTWSASDWILSVGTKVGGILVLPGFFCENDEGKFNKSGTCESLERL